MRSSPQQVTSPDALLLVFKNSDPEVLSAADDVITKRRVEGTPVRSRLPRSPTGLRVLRPLVADGLKGLRKSNDQNLWMALGEVT